jgi:hypothetical protein
MIKDIFIRATIVTRLETGPLGSHLDALATALLDQRYTAATIGIHLREAHAFGCWLAENHHHLSEISEVMLEHYLNACSTHQKSLSRKRRKNISAGVNTLLRHLRNVGAIPPQPAETVLETEGQQWLTRYREHLEKVLGLAPTTRQKYLFFATRLLRSISRQGALNGQHLLLTESSSLYEPMRRHVRDSGHTEQLPQSGLCCAFLFHKASSLPVWRLLSRPFVDTHTLLCHSD